MGEQCIFVRFASLLKLIMHISRSYICCHLFLAAQDGGRWHERYLIKRQNVQFAWADKHAPDCVPGSLNYITSRYINRGWVHVTSYNIPRHLLGRVTSLIEDLSGVTLYIVWGHKLSKLAGIPSLCDIKISCISVDHLLLIVIVFRISDYRTRITGLDSQCT